MAGMDKLAVLVNSFGSSVISVGREVGLDISLNKAQVSPGQVYRTDGEKLHLPLAH